MSLKISSMPFGARGPGGNNQVRLRIADVKSAQSTKESSSASSVSDGESSKVSQE